MMMALLVLGVFGIWSAAGVIGNALPLVITHSIWLGMVWVVAGALWSLLELLIAKVKGEE